MVGGTGMMLGVEDFGAEVGAEVVAGVVVDMMIGIGVKTLAKIVVGATKRIIGVGVVAGGVATETDSIPVVLPLVALLRVLVHTTI